MEGWAFRLEDEGIRASLLGGALFGALEMLGALMLQGAPLLPVEAAASLILRERVFQAGYWALALPLGVAVHFSLAFLYGYAFGLISTETRLRTRLSFAHEALLGCGFGGLVWAVNFLIISRGLYPWLFATNQLAQALLHTLGFGLPLSLLFARSERKRVARMGAP